MDKRLLGTWLEAYAEGSIISSAALLLIGMILKNKG